MANSELAGLGAWKGAPTWKYKVSLKAYLALNSQYCLHIPSRQFLSPLSLLPQLEAHPGSRKRTTKYFVFAPLPLYYGVFPLLGPGAPHASGPGEDYFLGKPALFDLKVRYFVGTH